MVPTRRRAIGSPGSASSATRARWRLLGRFAAPPVVLGHSMGCVIGQQLAAKGLVPALILVGPAGRYGILPSADFERDGSQGLMNLGPFWQQAVHANFEVAVATSLNRIPPPSSAPCSTSSGRNRLRRCSSCSSGCWTMGARRRSTPMPSAARSCACAAATTGCLAGTAEPRPPPIAAPCSGRSRGHGHMLLVEPGAEAIARKLARWAATSDGCSAGRWIRR